MKAVTKILQDAIKADEDNIKRHTQILDFFVENRGKPYNGHTWRKLPEGLRYKLDCGMHHIIIDDKSHLIGYVNSDVEILPERLAYTDLCHASAAEERIEKIKDIIKDPAKFERLCKLFKKLKRLNKLLTEVSNECYDGEFSSYPFPPYYNFVRAAGLDTTMISDIHFKR